VSASRVVLWKRDAGEAPAAKDAALRGAEMREALALYQRLQDLTSERAQRSSLTAYDAATAVLAEEPGATLAQRLQQLRRGRVLTANSLATAVVAADRRGL
jgi:hypothetical protein